MTRPFIYILPIFFFWQTALAQNVLTNGNFEQYTNCPLYFSYLSYCTGWAQYTGGTSDFFHTCATASSPVVVPNNVFGYQVPASGNGYGGGYVEVAGGITPPFSYAEYLTTTFPPLRPSYLYEVSMSVSLANFSQYATNGLGIFFFKNGPTSVGVNTPLTIDPQVSYINYGVQADTANWTRLTGTFTPDSAYDHLVVGAFNTINTVMTQLGSNPNIFSYYFYDSIVVRMLNKISFNFTDTMLCTGDTFSLPYTVLPGFVAGTGNTFIAQLSDNTGYFFFPTTIGFTTATGSGTIFCTIPSTIPAGTGYRIRIIATNPADSSGNNGKDIGIGTPVSKPVAANNGPICTGNSIYLSASTTTVSSALKWRWTGPNGFTSNLQNPIISNPLFPSSAGNYVVTASVYGCRASDTTAVSMTGLPGPNAVTASTNAPVCITDTLKLFSIAAPSATYSWIGPNSFHCSINDTSIIFPTVNASGNYIVSASLNGCVTKDTVSVLIKPIPANFSVTDNSPVCAGGTYAMNASSTSAGVTYSWTGPFGFTSSSGNTFLGGVSSANAGDYVVVASLNGCVLKDTVTLVVNPLPAKPFASSNTPVCTGGSLNFNSSSAAAGNTYNWTGPNAFSSSSQNPSIQNVTLQASGDYIITVTTPAGCTAKDTETVVVNIMPVVQASNNTPVCEGTTLNLFSTVVPPGPLSWIGPNSFTSSSQNPVIINAATTTSGDYIVSVTQNGCTARDTTTVLVKPNPIAPVTGSNTPVCIGATLNLYAASNAGSTYSWTGPNSYSSTQQNPFRNNITIGDAGAYSVTATLNGCISPPGNTTVVVNQKPFVTIYSIPADSVCQGDPVIFVALPANTSAGATFKWTRNTNPSVLSTNDTFTTTSLNNNDRLRCEITDPAMCGTAFRDTSNELKMTVLPWLSPSVSIISNPSTPIAPYEKISFTAIAVNAGNKPKYQWKRNGSDVIGATAYQWGTQLLYNGDSINVIMISDYKCPQPKTATSNKIKVTVLTGVEDVKGANSISLYPNPNSGLFTIKGNVNSNKEVTIQIVNASGQLVYETTCLPNNQTLNTQINVEHLAKGVYSLRIKTATINTIKFSIE